MELNMKEYQDMLKEDIKKIVKHNNLTPTLHIINDGVDERCKVYMKSKLNMCKELGINCVVDIIKTQKEMFDLCDRIRENYEVSICQFPIRKDLKESYLIESEGIDVDGLFSYNDLFNGLYSVAPATAKGIYKYIKYKYKTLRGINIVLVGMGELCNKPLMIMLANEGATISTFNTSTDVNYKKKILKNADIVVCAGGRKGTVKTSELSDTKNVLVFNVGIVFDENGKLDTELEIDIEKPNVDYTPRIKGVGVLTVLSLLDNVANMSYYKKIEKNIDNFVSEVV